MELNEALEQLGILKGKVGPLEAERDRLLGNKESLEADLAKAKERYKKAESESDSLKEKVPGDGSTVLSKADAERWRVLSGIAGELGGVDKVQARLTRVGELEAEKTKVEREQTIRAAGYEPKKLERLIGSAGFKLEGEGDDQKVLITVGDEDHALSDWAEAEGITDLLNVARLGPAPSSRTPTGPGERPRTVQGAKPPGEIYKEKLNDPTYQM